MSSPTELTAPLPPNNHGVSSSSTKQSMIDRLASAVHQGVPVDDLFAPTESGASVRFNELPEVEKQRVREAAHTILRSLSEAILSTNPTHPDHDALEIAVALDELTVNRNDVRILINLWRNRPTSLWVKAIAFFTTTADYLCRHGEAFIAIDVCQEGLKYFPASTRLIQLKSWALAQSGATHQAQRLLESIGSETAEAVETHALLARTWKDMAQNESTAAHKHELLTISLSHYEKAYDVSVAAGRAEYYPAINCAALCHRLEQTDTANLWAERAKRLATEETPRGFWAEATLAEAALILGQPDDARLHYRTFVAECGFNRAVIASARRQAAGLLKGDVHAERFLAECLPLPSVVVYSAGCPLIASAKIAVVCPWTPADAHSVNQLLESGTEVHLVLPLPLSAFGSKLLGLDTDSISRWTRLATSVTVTHPRGSHLSDELARFCAILQYGRARRLADTGSAELSFPRPHEAESNFVGAYQSALIALHDGRDPLGPTSRLRSVSFVDVVGYGRLDEPQVDFFQKTLLPQLAHFLRTSSTAPSFVQTWGDALYIGFESVRDGGVGALALLDYFTSLPWDSFGFPQALKLRLALHTGPMITAIDPFNGNPYFTGTVISRGARIEPLAHENQIFCSDAFAAAATALHVRDFTLAFAGTYLLPKNAGEEPLFRVLPPV